MACDMLLNPADALDQAYAAYANDELDIQTREPGYWEPNPGPLLATACASFSFITGPLAKVLVPTCLVSGLILPTPAYGPVYGPVHGP